MDLTDAQLVTRPFARAYATFALVFSFAELALFWSVGGVFGNPWPLLSTAMLAVALLLPRRTTQWYLALTGSTLLLILGVSQAFLR